MSGGTRSGRAWRTAFCGLMTALATVVLYGASIAPTGQLGLTAIAGLFPMSAVVTVGLTAGFLCWVASGLLGLLLLPTKSCVLLFLLFFGVYPVLKSVIERIDKPVIEWICKLAFFNGALAVSLVFAKALLMDSLPSALQETRILWLIVNGVFCVYDIGLSKIVLLYMNRIDKQLRK